MLPFWDIRGNLNSLNKIINKHKEAQDKSERDNIVISLVAKKKKKKFTPGTHVHCISFYKKIRRYSQKTTTKVARYSPNKAMDGKVYSHKKKKKEAVQYQAFCSTVPVYDDVPRC
jgi:hypothetical protein